MESTLRLGVPQAGGDLRRVVWKAHRLVFPWSLIVWVVPWAVHQSSSRQSSAMRPTQVRTWPSDQALDLEA